MVVPQWKIRSPFMRSPPAPPLPPALARRYVTSHAITTTATPPSSIPPSPPPLPTSFVTTPRSTFDKKKPTRRGTPVSPSTTLTPSASPPPSPPRRQRLHFNPDTPPQPQSSQQYQKKHQHRHSPNHDVEDSVPSPRSEPRSSFVRAPLQHLSLFSAPRRHSATPTPTPGAPPRHPRWPCAARPRQNPPATSSPRRRSSAAPPRSPSCPLPLLRRAPQPAKKDSSPPAPHLPPPFSSSISSEDVESDEERLSRCSPQRDSSLTLSALRARLPLRRRRRRRTGRHARPTPSPLVAESVLHAALAAAHARGHGRQDEATDSDSVYPSAHESVTAVVPVGARMHTGNEAELFVVRNAAFLGNGATSMAESALREGSRSSASGSVDTDDDSENENEEEEDENDDDGDDDITNSNRTDPAVEDEPSEESLCWDQNGAVEEDDDFAGTEGTDETDPERVACTLRVLSRRFGGRGSGVVPLPALFGLPLQQTTGGPDPCGANAGVSFFEDDFVKFACGHADRGVEKRRVSRWLARLWSKL